MLFDQVHFKKITIHPRPIIQSLPAYKPVSWDENWEVVCVPNGDLQTIYEWAKNQIVGSVDVVICHEGNALVAFNDPTDAILFKISYQN